MMIAEKTGWSKNEILNNYSMAELYIMLADMPRMVKKKKIEETQTFESDDDLAAWLGAK